MLYYPWQDPFSTLNIWSAPPQSFPSVCRGKGFGIVNGAANLGGLAAPLLFGVSNHAKKTIKQFPCANAAIVQCTGRSDAKERTFWRVRLDSLTFGLRSCHIHLQIVLQQYYKNWLTFLDSHWKVLTHCRLDIFPPSVLRFFIKL